MTYKKDILCFDRLLMWFNVLKNQISNILYKTDDKKYPICVLPMPGTPPKRKKELYIATRKGKKESKLQGSMHAANQVMYISFEDTIMDFILLREAKQY